MDSPNETRRRLFNEGTGSPILSMETESVCSLGSDDTDRSFAEELTATTFDNTRHHNVLNSFQETVDQFNEMNRELNQIRHDRDQLAKELLKIKEENHAKEEYVKKLELANRDNQSQIISMSIRREAAECTLREMTDCKPTSGENGQNEVAVKASVAALSGKSATILSQAQVIADLQIRCKQAESESERARTLNGVIESQFQESNTEASNLTMDLKQTEIQMEFLISRLTQLGNENGNLSTVIQLLREENDAQREQVTTSARKLQETLTRCESTSHKSLIASKEHQNQLDKVMFDARIIETKVKGELKLLQSQINYSQEEYSKARQQCDEANNDRDTAMAKTTQAIEMLSHVNWELRDVKDALAIERARHKKDVAMIRKKVTNVKDAEDLLACDLERWNSGEIQSVFADATRANTEDNDDSNNELFVEARDMALQLIPRLCMNMARLQLRLPEQQTEKSMWTSMKNMMSGSTSASSVIDAISKPASTPSSPKHVKRPEQEEQTVPEVASTRPLPPATTPTRPISTTTPTPLTVVDPKPSTVESADTPPTPSPTQSPTSVKAASTEAIYPTPTTPVTSAPTTPVKPASTPTPTATLTLLEQLEELLISSTPTTPVTSAPTTPVKSVSTPTTVRNKVKSTKSKSPVKKAVLKRTKKKDATARAFHDLSEVMERSLLDRPTSRDSPSTFLSANDQFFASLPQANANPHTPGVDRSFDSSTSLFSVRPQ